MPVYMHVNIELCLSTIGLLKILVSLNVKSLSKHLLVVVDSQYNCTYRTVSEVTCQGGGIFDLWGSIQQKVFSSEQFEYSCR